LVKYYEDWKLIIDIINGKGTTKKYFPGMVRMFKRFGIDMVRFLVVFTVKIEHQYYFPSIDGRLFLPE